MKLYDLLTSCRGSALSPSEQLVLIHVAHRAATGGELDGGVCWASVATLASDTGLSGKTVRRALDVLARNQVLAETPRPGETTEYRVTGLAPRLVVRADARRTPQLKLPLPKVARVPSPLVSTPPGHGDHQPDPVIRPANPIPPNPPVERGGSQPDQRKVIGLVQQVLDFPEPSAPGNATDLERLVWEADAEAEREAWREAVADARRRAASGDPDLARRLFDAHRAAFAAVGITRARHLVPFLRAMA